jgi:hypothetical protein
MHPKFKRWTTATALFLALVMGQWYLPVGFAESAASLGATPQQATAILTTGSNGPVTVNGANAVSGATVMSGAAIETTDQTGASLTIPGHFTLDIAPKASLSVQFERNSIKVNLIKGCVMLHTTKDTTGEIDTAHGVAKSDVSKNDRLDVCDPPLVGAPATAAAGGLSAGGKIAIVGGVVGALALIPVLTGGNNPSPTGP